MQLEQGEQSEVVWCVILWCSCIELYLIPSVRQRWNWIPPKQGESAASKGAQALGGTAATTKKTGPTIILFVIGGITYSEMRAAYEAASATDHHIIIGE